MSALYDGAPATGRESVRQTVRWAGSTGSIDAFNWIPSPAMQCTLPGQHQSASYPLAPVAICCRPAIHHTAPLLRVLQEHRQHRAAVEQVMFSADGERLFTAGGDGSICVYDVAQIYLPVKMLATNGAPGRVRPCVALLRCLAEQ